MNLYVFAIFLWHKFASLLHKDNTEIKCLNLQISKRKMQGHILNKTIGMFKPKSMIDLEFLLPGT